MRLTIAWRVFLAVLLTALLVAASGLGMLRAGMERGFGRYVSDIELSRLGVFATALESTYRKQGAWPVLDEAQRPVWLKNEFLALSLRSPEAFSQLVAQTPPDDQPPALPPGFKPHWPPPDPMALQDRVGLLDDKGALVAGVRAPPDTRRRPLKLDGHLIGYLTLMPAADPSDALARAFLADQSRNVLLIAGMCVVLSALAAGLLAAHFRRPIVRLVDAARELTSAHFGTRVDIQRSDELGVLAGAFNHLARMLEQHESARRQWVADTSHELRTPVAVLRAQIEALQDGIRQPDAAQLAAMHRQIQALSRLIEELYELARADVGQLEYRMAPVDPWALVCAEVESFRGRFEQAGLVLQCQDGPSGGRLMADADRLRQVVANLLQNSLRYTDRGGRVELSSRSEGPFWTLQIDDSAPGVPDAAMARLAERFFRVEQSRNRAHGGSGLGLALCQRIAAAHGGALRFAHSPLGGLRVCVEIKREAA